MSNGFRVLQRNIMKFELAEITTKDGLIHQGMVARPERTRKKAVLWVHGLTGKFYGDPVLMNVFADECNKKGMAFASFNNRGHDIMSSIRKGKGYVTIGASSEVFKDCVFDIDAGISFLADQGFRHIILAGNSTGANKVCYYASHTKDSRVMGVVLSGPISDRLGMKGDIWFPATEERKKSLLTPNSSEDVFNYGDENNVLSIFQNISVPTMVVLAGNDETADRPIETIQNIFDSHSGSKKYVSTVIPDTTHGYEGKQQEFVTTVVDWVENL